MKIFSPEKPLFLSSLIVS
jgi:hypothetical protein